MSYSNKILFYDVIEDKESPRGIFLDKIFESKVECNGKELGRGIGKSKKASEMEAAKNALEKL